MRHPFVFSSLALFGLAACSTAGPPAPAADAPVAPTEITEPAPEPAPPPAPPMPKTRPAPEKLMGLRPDKVQGLLGAPTLIRRDGPLYLALYEGGGCVLEIVFYEDMPSGGYAARHITGRSASSGGAMDAGRCLMLVTDGMIPDTLTAIIPEAGSDEVF